MSFQISYTVKNPSTDFTWMDVSETKETKTDILFLRQRCLPGNSVSNCISFGKTDYYKSSLKHKRIFKMSLKKPISSLEAWSALALLHPQIIVFRKHLPKSYIYTLQSPNWEAVH